MNFDEIRCALNPTQANDLVFVLGVTRADRRIDVALAFSGLSVADWSGAAGLGNVQVGRWIGEQHRFPLGAAFRLAKVLGVDAEILFQYWIR